MPTTPGRNQSSVVIRLYHHYFGLELHQTQNIPIGLIHSSYGGSAVEDWISQETLGDGTTGPCIGNITHSMGIPSNQYNGQIRPVLIFENLFLILI